MAITVVLPPSGAFSFTDIPDIVEFLAFESVVTSLGTTQFTGSGVYKGQAASYTVTGTGFSTTPIGGDNYITGGVISSINVTVGSNVATFTSVDIDMAVFGPAIIAEDFGTDRLAVENYLLNRAWDVTLGAADDVATSTTIIGDGALFNPLKDDVFRGLGGNDQLFGGGGNDRLLGGANNDILSGGVGLDVLLGGNGRDQLLGGLGNDRLNGGAGNDKLNGGQGRDVMTGGKGNDDFIFADGFGVNRIRDFEENNRREDIDLTDVSAITGFRVLKNKFMSQQGDDVVIDDGVGLRILVLDTDIADMNKGDFIF